jgi:hypothetical protein
MKETQRRLSLIIRKRLRRSRLMIFPRDRFRGRLHECAGEMRGSSHDRGG